MIRGKRQRPLPWSQEEFAILADVYTREGIEGAIDALPERSWGAITMMASKLGLRSAFGNQGRQPILEGARLDEAIRLREQDGWAFERIGKHFGVSEIGAQNAILIALCPRKGFTPAERDDRGCLLPSGVARLRDMLAAGAKGIDICTQLGLSAATVSRERRTYSAELAAAGGVLPPPGGGKRYSGAKIANDVYRQVDELLLKGYGAPRVATWTGVSKVQVGRRRVKLVAKLARDGRALPGCDLTGRRTAYKDSLCEVSEAQRDILRAELLAGTAVSRAAKIAVIGESYAYKFRDELRDELAKGGKSLPPPTRLGRTRAAEVDRTLNWLPAGKRNLITYRRHLKACGGDMTEARRRTIAELMPKPAPAAPPRKRTFEELLAAVARGEVRVVEKVPMPSRGYASTLGGVSAGML